MLIWKDVRAGEANNWRVVAQYLIVWASFLFRFFPLGFGFLLIFRCYFSLV